MLKQLSLKNHAYENKVTTLEKDKPFLDFIGVGVPVGTSANNNKYL